METEETTVTEEEVKRAIQTTPSKKSAGPDGVSSLHLKNLGKKALRLLAKLFTLTLNTNVIPQIWKTSKLSPIPKPGKDPTAGKS